MFLPCCWPPLAAERNSGIRIAASPFEDASLGSLLRPRSMTTLLCNPSVHAPSDLEQQAASQHQSCQRQNNGDGSDRDSRDDAPRTHARADGQEDRANDGDGHHDDHSDGGPAKNSLATLRILQRRPDIAPCRPEGISGTIRLAPHHHGLTDAPGGRHSRRRQTPRAHQSSSRRKRLHGCTTSSLRARLHGCHALDMPLSSPSRDRSRSRRASKKGAAAAASARKKTGTRRPESGNSRKCAPIIAAAVANPAATSQVRGITTGTTTLGSTLRFLSNIPLRRPLRLSP